MNTVAGLTGYFSAVPFVFASVYCGGVVVVANGPGVAARRRSISLMCLLYLYFYLYLHHINVLWRGGGGGSLCLLYL